MTFEILYYAADGQHITLKADGSIEIYIPPVLPGSDPLIIPYSQAKILKGMILAQSKLERKNG